MITNGDDKIGSIIKEIYPDLVFRYTNSEFLKEKAIVALRNEDVSKVDNHIIDLLPCFKKTYYSSDFICKGLSTRADEELLYPTKFLNSLYFLGFPEHSLTLGIGVLAMFLRNLN